ncbi:MAG: type III-B CRISPR-associated protein Cas10/Cmr2 [Firmicutes bacterium]|jgi:CRISPR-associated protein Cmr2|nr:type III-B CRISPR-associated protein Cas10/Cmr2 [Bacillota bacterium]
MDSRGMLEFSFAPIQGFVNQARRTRDFWAGSYLISYLAAQAMVGVERANGNNEIVFPAIDDDFIIQAVRSGILPPKDESNLATRIGSVPNRFTALCEDPVVAGKAGAKALHEAWRKIAEGVRQGIVWAIPELEQDNVCAGWNKQIETLWEVYWVAGTDSAGLGERKNWRHFFTREEEGDMCSVCGERAIVASEGLSRRRVRERWQEITSRLNKRWPYALDDEGIERLCAVCLVKRIFPYLAQDLLGWPVIQNFPSTLDFAPGAGQTASGKPSYYAILIMDGDRLGLNLSHYPKQKKDISNALAKFSRAVVPTVEQNFKGRVVYAGGDDVLALLPLKTALRCAGELRTIYQQMSPPNINLTISAAILYVHGKSPLQAALSSAHSLLDKVAKDGVGRDAFALQVEKRSGSPLRLAKPWESQGHKWAEEIDSLSSLIFPQEESAYSSRFLYNTAELLTPFLDNKLNESQKMGADKIVPLLTAEYLRNRDLTWPHEYTQEEIKIEAINRMQVLYKLLLWEQREKGQIKTCGFQPQALPLLRFLAAEGVGR